MNKIQDLPAFHGQNAYGKPIKILDLRAQLRVLVDALGRHHLHRDKAVSTKTCADRSLNAGMFFDQLRQDGFAIKAVFNLSQQHVEHLAKRWESEKLAAATVQTRFSHMRWLAAAIGKAGMVRHPTYYGVDAASVTRVLAAEDDKSWSSHGVDYKELVAKASELDLLVGVQLSLMFEFGLRVREAILIKPKIAHVADSLRVEEGTKGGRSRVILVRYDSQLAAIEEAKSASTKGKKGSLVHAGKDFDYSQRRFYYVMDILGVTRKKLGVTGHGLRHQYANDLFEQISGTPSTVRGGSPILDRAKDRAARQAVTSDLGHVRIDVTAAYTGPLRTRNVGRKIAPPSGPVQL